MQTTHFKDHVLDELRTQANGSSLLAANDPRPPVEGDLTPEQIEEAFAEAQRIDGDKAVDGFKHAGGFERARFEHARELERAMDPLNRGH